MKRKIGLLLILSLAFCTSGVLAAGLPAYGADEGVIIYEVNSGDILFQQKQNEKFYPASTTKLMTALVAAFETRYRELYSRLGPPVPVEVINWRVLSRMHSA